jgi:hypothetical protein
MRPRAPDPRDAGDLLNPAEESPEDIRHSHGLSWSSVTHDDVVDNLLFSLDNFSRGHVAPEPRDWRSDSQQDEFLNSLTARSVRPMEATAHRPRRGTQSSSTSFDVERAPIESPHSRISTTSPGRRSNSSAAQYPPRSINSRFRSMRAYGTSRTSLDGPGHTNKHSDASSADFYYGPPLDSARQAWTNPAGRSFSMDNMQAESRGDLSSSLHDRSRAVAAMSSRYDPDADAAPEPIVAAGPRRMQNPTATGPVYVNPAPLRNKSSALRKVTPQPDTRSTGHLSPSIPIPEEIRSQAADFVRTSSVSGGSRAALPSTSHGEAAPSPDVRRWEASPPPAAAAPAAAAAPVVVPEKQGFFKRVFGGGAAARTAPPTHQSERPTTKPNVADVAAESMPPPPTPPTTQPLARSRSHTSVVDPVQNRAEAQQTTNMSAAHPPVSLNRKSSSFFRRRKKSTSGSSSAPPLPLAIHSPTSNAVLSLKPPEPSPSISSLRKAMGFYLSSDTPASSSPKLDENLRPQTSESHNTDDLDIFHPGYISPPLDSSLRSLSEQGDRETRLTAGKRKPQTLSMLGASGAARGDPVNRDSLATIRQSKVDYPAVSPLLGPVPFDKETGDTSSRPSTGEKIIAGVKPGAASPDAIRSFSAGTGVSLEMSDGVWSPSQHSQTSSSRKPSRADGEGWVVTRHGGTERPSSRRSERLILQPSPIGEEESMAKSQDDVSTLGDAVGPPAITTDGDGDHNSAQALQADSSRLGSALTPIISRQSSAGDLAWTAQLIDEDIQYKVRAKRIFEGDEEDVSRAEASAWMGENNTLSTRTLQAYMQLFDFAGMNILAALRALCGKLQLRGETQQFDRIITALSARWCECNTAHGFKAQDVVHTIIYSVILLNTDLHLADIQEKMSRNAYVKNTLPTIRRVVADAAPNAFDETLKPGSAQHPRPHAPWMDGIANSPSSPTFNIPEISIADRQSIDAGRTSTMGQNSVRRLSMRPGVLRSDSESTAVEPSSDGSSNALVNSPWVGSVRGWENELESVLKSFYMAIGSKPLPLQGAMSSDLPPNGRNLSVVDLNGKMTRTASIVSRAPSDNMSYRSKQGFGSRWANPRASRSRQKLYPASTVGSSRTSLEDSGSIWSPTQSSKYSYSKTLTSASVRSFGVYADPFKHSIGFANALSQAIIREETTVGANGANGGGGESDSASVAGGAAEDDTLALLGAPWAKEGLVKHKHHLETTDRKAKERSWVDCFAVISKGKLTLFAFNTTGPSKPSGRKAVFGGKSGKAASVTGAKVGGGDWMENAEQLEVFVLRQTIASTLPPPGYSKTRPHVWALSLPTGAVHLFQVGTPDIAEEFITTSNYWSARLSKEPLSGGVSNIEYGWSDRVINPGVLDRDGARSVESPPVSLTRQMGHMHSMSTDRNGGGGGRASLQSGSLRGSLDTAGFGSNKARLPGDKITIVDWQPPSQSMMASQLMEVDQLRQLTAYVKGSEDELEKHNELKTAIELAVSGSLSLSSFFFPFLPCAPSHIRKKDPLYPHPHCA